MRKNIIQSGFTIVEIVVVLTIIASLLTLASLSLTSAAKRSRDNERRADIEMMSQCLENNFLSTQTYFGTIAELATCPRATEFMTPPELSAPATILATNATTTITGVRPLPTKDTYVFQPLTATNTLCTTPETIPCAKYNLYYFSEFDNIVNKVSSQR